MNQPNPQTRLDQPTLAQRRCIMALCRENNLNETAYQPETKRDASRMIDELKALPGSKPRFVETPIGPAWSRTERIQAFAIVTRLTVEKARSSNTPLRLDEAFWASVRETFREY